MLQLLEPIWLLSMAGIIVPVLIHLWNDRKGKVLRIGSVALLEGASKRMSWSRRITEWWLLILRCLLLIFLALLLAGPYWQRRPGLRGWVVTDGGRPYATMVDSMVKVGFERHMLRDTLDYWTGFRAADVEAPAGVPFYIFTTGLVNRFKSERPSTVREVHWYIYTPVDSVARWVQRSWAVSRDSMIVLNGLSRATGTSWERETVALAGSSVDTTILRYRVYGADGKYVVAAMKALSRVTGRPMAEGDGGWLFWLSTKPLPAVEGYTKVWSYGNGVDSVKWRKEAESGRLPLLIGGLLPVDTPLKDRRMIDLRQVEPEHVVSRGAVVPLESVDLRPVVWGIVLLLFLLERIKSFDRGRKKA